MLFYTILLWCYFMGLAEFMLDGNIYLFIYGSMRPNCTKDNKVIFVPLENQNLKKWVKEANEATWFGGS